MTILSKVTWRMPILHKPFCISFLCSVMVSVLASSAIDCGYELRSCQTKEYKIGVCCFSAENAALRRKSKDWLARNQNNAITLPMRFPNFCYFYYFFQSKFLIVLQYIIWKQKLIQNNKSYLITKEYKIGVCCFSAENAALRRKSKDWLARNQNNVSEWSDTSTRGLFQ
jgi:hypothetical protein